jgi:hypothetical protein
LFNALNNDGAVDVGVLHVQKTALQARMDELAALFAEGSINAAQLKRGTAELATAVASLDAELAAATHGNPVAALLGTGHGGAQLEERWKALSPDIRGKIIDQLMVVTINNAPKGLRRFDPQYVDIEWRK